MPTSALYAFCNKLFALLISALTCCFIKSFLQKLYFFDIQSVFFITVINNIPKITVSVLFIQADML